MVPGISFALLAATVYGLLGVAFELAAKRGYPKWDFIMLKQLWGTAIGLAFVVTRRVLFNDPRVLMLALIGALFYVATCSAYLTASRERDIAANWTILNLSVVVPVLLSVVMFHDRLSLSKVAGFGLTVVAIILIGGLGTTKAKFSRQWIVSIIVAFLLNGWFVILLRFVPQPASGLFTFYFYGFSALLTFVYKVCARQGSSRAPDIYLVAALGAAAHWSGIMLTIVALDRVGRVSAQAGLIVYPITNGLTIVMGVFLGSLWLHQKVAAREKWGMACGVIAMALLSLG
jgi:drug/metabolite transporter (DMT)-like permease